MYTPVNPNFIISKWVVRGSTLHGHVSMMAVDERGSRSFEA